MTKKTILIIAIGVVVLILGGTYFYVSSRPQVSTPTKENDTNTLPQTQPTKTADLYDRNKWNLVKQAEADFDSDSNAEKILLLKSVHATGESGVGEPLNDIQLFVIKNDRIIFDYNKEGVKPSEIQGVNPTQFFMDDDLDVRDVTGDKVPEIIFHSGFSEASDYTTLEHILQFNESKNSFTDSTRKEFFDSGTHGLRWLVSGARALVVIATRNWDLSVPIEQRCHYCQSPFQYSAYQWSDNQRSFVLYLSIDSSKSYEDAASALQGDWSKIQNEFLK